MQTDRLTILARQAAGNNANRLGLLTRAYQAARLKPEERPRPVGAAENFKGAVGFFPSR